MHKKAYYVINSITAYRLIMAPVLIILLFRGDPEIFKWLLAVSFLTDAVDGWLARRFKVTSIFGTKLDSLGDDLTIVAATVGVAAFDGLFFISRAIPVAVLLILFGIQVIMALSKYGKVTSFHTYLSKAAAVAQGVFFLIFFFFPGYAWLFFNIAFCLTVLDLLEEIILVNLLPEWRANVKGLYWIKPSHAGTPDKTDIPVQDVISKRNEEKAEV